MCMYSLHAPIEVGGGLEGWGGARRVNWLRVWSPNHIIIPNIYLTFGHACSNCTHGVTTIKLWLSCIGVGHAADILAGDKGKLCE